MGVWIANLSRESSNQTLGAKPSAVGQVADAIRQVAVNFGHLAPHHYSLVALEDAGRRGGNVILPIWEGSLVVSFFLVGHFFFVVSRVGSWASLIFQGDLLYRLAPAAVGAWQASQPARLKLQYFLTSSVRMAIGQSNDGLAGVGRKLLQIWGHVRVTTMRILTYFGISRNSCFPMTKFYSAWRVRSPQYSINLEHGKPSRSRSNKNRHPAGQHPEHMHV